MGNSRCITPTHTNSLQPSSPSGVGFFVAVGGGLGSTSVGQRALHTALQWPSHQFDSPLLPANCLANHQVIESHILIYGRLLSNVITFKMLDSVINSQIPHLMKANETKTA